VIDAATHFDRRYEDDADPWNYESDWAEIRRHRLMGWSLSRATYERAFEPACGSGTFTEILGRRCESLIACDASPRAIEHARRRLGNASGVALSAATVPTWWPEGTFDLIVLADFSYYLTNEQVTAVKVRCDSATGVGAQVLTVHWTGDAADFVSQGRRMHDLFADDIRFRNAVAMCDDRTILDVWERIA
jgi:SAM-dependent methyltransferase